jgi:hypothetical protein
VRSPDRIVSRLSADVAKTSKDKAPRCRSKDGAGHEILHVVLSKRTGGLAQA